MEIVLSSLTSRGLLDTNSKRGSALIYGLVINYIIYILELVIIIIITLRVVSQK